MYEWQISKQTHWFVPIFIEFVLKKKSQPESQESLQAILQKIQSCWPLNLYLHPTENELFAEYYLYRILKKQLEYNLHVNNLSLEIFSLHGGWLS